MSAHLLRSRKFAPLFWCQFFAAFNDTYLKSALTFIVVAKLAPAAANTLTLVGSILLTAPPFLLAALGGQWADRYDKAKVAQWLKLVEFGAVAIAAASFVFQSVSLLFIALAMFGVLSALFGPVKYGILPDHLAKSELPGGNALVEGATFIAAILGPTAAAIATRTTHDMRWAAALCILFAAIAYVAARFIPATGQAAPTLKIEANLFASTWHLLGTLHADRRLWRGAIITSLFWSMAVVVYTLLTPIVELGLGGDPMVFNIYNALFAIGIAAGSGLAAWVLAGRTLMLPTPIAAFVLGLVSLDLAAALHGAATTGPLLGPAAFFATWRAWHVGLDLVLLAVAGGLYIVPAFAAVQAWAPADQRARVVAAVNVLNAACIVAGLVATIALQRLGASFSTIFLVLGIASLGAAAWIFAVLPTNPLRDLGVMVFRIFYRLEVHGQENLEAAGPNAIIALNHVSLLDAPIAFSVLDQDPIFAVDTSWANKWWMKPVVRYMNALPLDPTRPLGTRQLIQTVKAGATLVIFPEGRLTRTGSLMKVYDGPGLIADRTGVPVVPVRIEGAEATRFSYLTDRQVNRRWFKRIKVTILPPRRLELAPELRGRARRQAAGAALYSIMSEMVFASTNTNRTVVQAVVDAAREHGPSHKAFEDPVTGTMTYKRAMIGARVLGGKLIPLTVEGRAVGLMLPNSIGAVVSLFALMSAGRVVAMVNFSAGAANIKSAGIAGQFDTIVTARSFIEKAKLDKLVAELSQTFRIVYLEDVRATVGTADKLKAALAWRKPLVARHADEPAVIMFTSGSEGRPKGVVLSHRNMLSNCAQARAVIDFGRDDKVFNVLPMFHALGLTIGTIVPTVFGVKVYLYPSPLHYRIIPELIYGSNATIFFGTDTFLMGYARTANAYDFRSLRYIVAGAEPVKESTRKVYLEKFGVRVLEGYGITEMAPVLSFNTPMFNKNGTVGRMMPGMKARLEAVDGIDEGGKLVVSGPNTMLGYMKDDQPGVLQPPPGGWHDTGDIVTIDDKGFITIKGRAKRFAKIAGEMVSLSAIEALAAELWPDAMSACATLPDERKGERVVMITQHPNASRGEFSAFARQKGASELMVPAEVTTLPTIPLLGSGKLDYAGVKHLIEERAKKAEAA